MKISETKLKKINSAIDEIVTSIDNTHISLEKKFHLFMMILVIHEIIVTDDE
jgi:hypothetical protein